MKISHADHDKLKPKKDPIAHQDECKTRIDIKLCITKHRKITESHNGSKNQQGINNNRTIALEWTAY